MQPKHHFNVDKHVNQPERTHVKYVGTTNDSVGKALGKTIIKVGQQCVSFISDLKKRSAKQLKPDMMVPPDFMLEHYSHCHV